MLIFVYGTLKRGGSNHAWLRGQRFVAEAATQPQYRQYDLGGYPGLVLDPAQGQSIEGELWEVDAEGLQRLDELEDVDGGEYVREPVPLRPPHDKLQAEGYRYLREVRNAREIGARWPE